MKLSDASRLRQTIADYRARTRRLDGDAAAMLDRLKDPENSDHVMAAFARVNPEHWAAMVQACVTAHYRARQHGVIAVKARNDIDRARKAEKAYQIIKKWNAKIPGGAADDLMRAALGTIERRIALEEEIAGNVLRNMSRKHDNLAARSSCVGWLAAEMERLSGKKNQKPVAALASVILDEEIGVDLVRRARPPLQKNRHVRAKKS